jgi:glycerophosphoryl diester phosphodiesterase
MHRFMMILLLAMPSIGVGQGVNRILAPYQKPTLIAHRGASAYAPEHTLEAYRLALEQGADFVEPDLQITRDGVLVCLHDSTLERTTDVEKIYPDRARVVKGKKTWPVVDFTLAEIQKLDAGSWKGAQFAGARIPTLQQMIDVVRGKAGIIPETKSPEEYSKRGLKMEQLLMEVLRKNRLDRPGADAKTPVIIQSFSAESLKLLRREYGCKLPLVYLFGGSAAKRYTTAEGLREIKTFADGIGPNKAVVLEHPELVREAKKLGMSVTVWTFRDGQTGKFPGVRQEMAYFLRDLGVDALFTDNPDKFPR